MNKRRWSSSKISFVAAAALVAAAACGSDDDAGDTTAAAATTAAPDTPATPPPDAPATQPPDTSADTTMAPASTTDEFEAEWAELIAAAQEEGEITFVGGPSGAEEDGPFYAEFGELFDLEVTLVGGPTDETTARIFAERTQGVYTVDIASLGGSGTQLVVEADVLEPLEPLIVHPEALDRSTGWRVDYFPWFEGSEVCTFWALRADTNFLRLFYNTETVSQEDLDGLQSWWDVTDERWRGRISIGAITEGEQSQDRIAAWQKLGPDWYDALLGNEPIVNLYGAAREQADGLARGQYDLVMFPAGGDAALVDAREAGLPVEEFTRTMEEGTQATMLQRLCVFKDAPHPNAAKLFANWVLTKEGGEHFNLYTGREDRVSLRNDVPQGKIPQDVWDTANMPGLLIVDTNNPDFPVADAESAAYLEEKFAELGLAPGT